MRTSFALAGLLTFILTVGLLSAGCGSNEGSPTNVAKRYITAVYNEDESAGDELALAFFGNYTKSEIIERTRKEIDKKKLIRINENKNYNSGTEAFVLADFDDGSYLVFTLVRDKGRWKIGEIR